MHPRLPGWIVAVLLFAIGFGLLAFALARLA